MTVFSTPCLIGIGVSHSAYVMRSACSAKLSAMVRILCKVLTVAINILIWDEHGSTAELTFLALGLMAGAFYEQAPLREEVQDDVGGSKTISLAKNLVVKNPPVTRIHWLRAFQSCCRASTNLPRIILLTQLYVREWFNGNIPCRSLMSVLMHRNPLSLRSDPFLAAGNASQSS